MKKQFLDAMGEIDDRFIVEAAPGKRKKTRWIGFAAVAAAACLLLVAGFLFWPGQQRTQPTGRYRYTIQQPNSAPVLRWEDRTLSERYTDMEFSGQNYGVRRRISQELVGNFLGTCTASGFDVYSDQVISEEFEVYAITGQQESLFVAVKLVDSYYVYFSREFEKPVTLGQLLAETNLRNDLPLTRFSDCTKDGEGYYALADDAEIWAILAACADAPLVEDDNFRTTERQYISFTATSETMGLCKRVLYITADGYLWSNIFDYAIIYEIGQDAAARIIACAQANSTETEEEPYTCSVAGTITEIGDGYLLIDDAILCWNEADGITFRVDTTAPEFSRWLKYYDFQVGDLVHISYRGEVEEDNSISGAYSISEAVLADGHIVVQG